MKLPAWLGRFIPESFYELIAYALFGYVILYWETPILDRGVALIASALFFSLHEAYRRR